MCVHMFIEFDLLPSYAANRSTVLLSEMAYMHCSVSSFTGRISCTSPFPSSMLRNFILHRRKFLHDGSIARSQLERFFEIFDGLIVVLQPWLASPFR